MRTLAGVAPAASPYGAILAPIERLSYRRRSSQTVGRALGRDPMTADVAQKIGNCSLRLALALEQQDDAAARALITAGHFCQQRLCPICEWRRTRAWRARLTAGLGLFAQAYPTHRAIFCTFTVRNCPIHETGATIRLLHRSFARMARAKFWPTPFYLRRTEVTIGAPSLHDGLPVAPCKGGRRIATDHSDGSAAAGPADRPLAVASPYGLWAHPHVHALLMVPGRYFGPGYVKQTVWQREWAAALGVDYAPVVDVRRATSKAGSPLLADAASDAVMEAAKYISKGNQIAALGPAVSEMHQQLKGQRMIQLSQRLGKFVRSGDITAEEMLDTQAVESSANPIFHTVVQWDDLLSSYTIAP